MASRNVVLCADDYAITLGVSHGIVELAELGRISATSVMVTSRFWPELAAPLRPFVGEIGIGLHLTLTFGAPLAEMPALAAAGTFPRLATLLRAAVLGRLPIGEIEAEITRQLDAFQDALGCEPDFVDGHQHVHALPGIRGALLRVLRKRGLAAKVWLRDPADKIAAIGSRRIAASKALAVAAFSAGFGQRARRDGFYTNAGFSGFSAFDEASDVARGFAAYLVALGSRPLVMCHPGHVDDPAGLDELVGQRARELTFLKSARFADLLAATGVALVSAPVECSKA